METFQAEIPEGEIPEVFPTGAIDFEKVSRPPTGAQSVASTAEVSIFVVPDRDREVDPENRDTVCSVNPAIAVRRKQLDEFKRSNKQRKYWFKKVSKRETRALLVMRKELSAMMKSTKKVRVTRFPQDHFCCEQIGLVSYDFLRKMETRTLAYDHIRESMENLFYIQDYFEGCSVPHTTLYMARMIEDMLTIVEDVANMLEIVAGQRKTKWSWVRQELRLDEKPEDVDPQSMIPLMKYFTQEKLLGAGGFGAVYKAIFCEAVPCSVKLVPITKFRAEKHACVDKVTASATNHPFLVKYFSTFTTEQAYVTIMEYIRGVDLHKVIKAECGLSEAHSRFILFQLGEAAIHMHLKGFIHRDIKPSNMMISPGCRIKLIDFDTIKISLANYVPRISQFYFERSGCEFRDREQAGTEPFLAPEVLRKHPYGRALDWWAIGVTAYNISFARIPFRGKKKDKDYIKLVSTSPVPYPEDRPIMPEFKQFMDDCFVKKASHRLCSSSATEFREHPFFSEIDCEGVYAGTATLELDSIQSSMEYIDNRWSPPAAVPKTDQRVTIELTDLSDTENQCALFTYISPAFQTCIKNAGRSGSITGVEREALDEELEDRHSARMVEDTGYRFEQYTRESGAEKHHRRHRKRRNKGL